jgi:hypothetical protein
LTILFFSYISHLEQRNVNDNLTNAINNQIGSFLTSVQQEAPKIGIKEHINWDYLAKVAKTWQSDAANEFPDVKKNNRKLLVIGICIIAGLFIIFCGLSVYFSKVKGITINWKKLLIENLIVFGFVGIIEFLFFTEVASKYIPVTPDIMTKTILDRIKYRLNNYIEAH